MQGQLCGSAWRDNPSGKMEGISEPSLESEGFVVFLSRIHEAKKKRKFILLESQLRRFMSIKIINSPCGKDTV